MANVQSPSGNEKSEKKERERGKLVGMPTQYIHILICSSFPSFSYQELYEFELTTTN
jgi:hypothetical protein